MQRCRVHQEHAGSLELALRAESCESCESRGPLGPEKERVRRGRLAECADQGVLANGHGAAATRVEKSDEPLDIGGTRHAQILGKRPAAGTVSTQVIASP